MRYISDDGKVFNTERECCEHEQHVENQRVKRKQLENECQDRVNAINQKYKELQNLLLEYEKDYGVKQNPVFDPFYRILDMMCGL